jgi:hypothetical protein
MPESIGDIPRQSTKLDMAETFGESDVTVGQSGVRIRGGSLEIDGTGASVPADSYTYNDSTSRGFRFTPKQDISTIEVLVSSQTGTASTAFVADLNENLITSKTGPFSAGDVITLSANLSAGTEYAVGLWDDGNAITYGTPQDGDYDYPRDSSTLTINSASVGAHPDDDSSSTESFSVAYGLKWVKVPGTSGTATVEWPAPTDIYAWDTATFQTTLDAETVGVYIEEDQADGWTEIAGTISRGDPIDADPSNNVRYRIELSRADTGNNPTLDAIYRRIKL